MPRTGTATGIAPDRIAAGHQAPHAAPLLILHPSDNVAVARAATPEVAARLMARLRWWEDYTARHGATMDNNPPPGNKAGGITTGRGPTYGCKPTPSLKLATHTAMYRRMRLDMDLNAGEIIDGTLDVAGAGERIFRLMLATASGERTLSEHHGPGDNEFVPWQLGAVL